MNKSIYEIAKKANVSIATVSRSLNNVYGVNEDTKKRVLKIVEEYGYSPNPSAKRLKTQKSNIIGLCFPHNDHIFLDAYLTEMLDELQMEISKAGYEFAFFTIDPNDANKGYSRLFLNKSVDGLIIGGTSFDDERVVNILKSKFPVILLGSKVRSLDMNYMDVDNEKITQLGLQYLVNKGHRHIAVYIGDRSFSTWMERESSALSFFKTHQDASSLRSEMVYEIKCFDDSYKATLNILNSQERPSAIFAMGDLQAAGVYKACHECGYRIPDDISVVGLDNLALSTRFCWPELTTIEIPRNDMAKMLIKNMLLLMNKEKPHVEPVIFDPILRIRQSVRSI